TSRPYTFPFPFPKRVGHPSRERERVRNGSTLQPRAWERGLAIAAHRRSEWTPDATPLGALSLGVDPRRDTPKATCGEGRVSACPSKTTCGEGRVPACPSEGHLR